MSSSAAMAAGLQSKEGWESKAGLGSTGQRTFYAHSLYELVTLLTEGKDECSVQMSAVPVHEAAAVVEVLSRAARSEAVAWTNPKLNNLRRLRDLSSKLQVVLDGLLVLLEEDPLNTGAGRELWKYGWALRNGADHLQGKGADSFRRVGNLLIRHGDNVTYESKPAEWLRARLPDLREQVTGLQAMSVSVPLDMYGPVDIGGGSSDKGKSIGGGSGSKGKSIGGGSGSKGKSISGGSGSKGKSISGGSGSNGKSISGGSGSKGKSISGRSGSNGKAISGGSGSKGKAIPSGSGSNGKAISGGSGSKGKSIPSGSGSNGKAISGVSGSKGKAISGGSGSGNNGKDGSGGAPVKKGYNVKKRKARYVKKRFGKGGSGSGEGGSGESGVSGNGGSGGAPVKKKKGGSGEGFSGEA